MGPGTRSSKKGGKDTEDPGEDGNNEQDDPTMATMSISDNTDDNIEVTGSSEDEAGNTPPLSNVTLDPKVFTETLLFALIVK